jgi:hypothetical protein
MKPKSKPPSITYNREWVPEGMPRERWRWVENASRGLRIVGACHEIARSEGWRMDHTGWFTDPWGDFGDLAVGYVLQLPSCGHEPLYVPAVADPYNPDCFIVDFHDTTSDKRDALRWADSMAERYAESERDFRTRDAAEQRIEELRDEIKAERAKHTAAVRELRALPPGQAQAPTLCALLRDSLADMRDNVRAAIKRIRTLSDDPFAVLQ